ncbi:ROK family protein [Salmonella enterica]|nr:ROK family protein [Salmonella enterica]
MKLAAFDIGGTALKMAIVNQNGTFLEKNKRQIIDSDGDQILNAMMAWIDIHPDFNGIAISAPGYVNPESGFIEMGGAIRKFDRFHLKNWLEERRGLPVTVENDANCVLLAERWQGKARNMRNFLVLTIGTGIGGAIFCNNALVHGASFKAGEFGYMQTTRPGIQSIQHSSMNENCTLRVLRFRYADYFGKKLEDVTGEEIFDRYEAGNTVCQRLVSEFFNDLGTGLYNLVNIFDPQVIFIGGGIVERPGFIEKLKENLYWFGIEKYINSVSTGNDAGLIGAVYHFNQQTKSLICD